MSRKNKNVLPFAIIPLRIKGKTVGKIVYGGAMSGGTEITLHIHWLEHAPYLTTAVKKQFQGDRCYTYEYGEGKDRVLAYEIHTTLKSPIRNPLGYVRMLARGLSETAEESEDFAKNHKRIKASIAKDFPNL